MSACRQRPVVTDAYSRRPGRSPRGPGLRLAALLTHTADAHSGSRRAALELTLPAVRARFPALPKVGLRDTPQVSYRDDLRIRTVTLALVTRAVVGLLAAVGTAMSALVGLAHRDLVWVTIADAAAATGLGRI